PREIIDASDEDDWEDADAEPTTVEELSADLESVLKVDDVEVTAVADDMEAQFRDMIEMSA
ncbi:hypothetical protein, partial [Brevibacterium sp.]|uniref:hypothetical protein n=1 Tax=Brevibacterium sp. TaxID=1701 RepID=UPI0026477631